jgi:hypothetical protein
MSNSPARKFILPFSPKKNNETVALEVEAAAVYSLAELERMKGGGLILKQPEETIHFIAEIGYPLWLLPNNSVTYIFDGLNNFNYSFPYAELPTAKNFIENLEANSKTREDYLTFLPDNSRYFSQPAREKEFSIRNLIVDLDFKKEFDVYRKEASEVTSQLTKIALLSPNLQETTISTIKTEINRLQSSLKEKVDVIQECLKRVNKTTSQCITELDYATEAVKDETEAKIKAQEELVNPKTVALNRECKKQIRKITQGFDYEIAKLEKLKAKTSKSIVSEEKKLKQYEQSAKEQARQSHLIYEKRWKAKSKETKKELSGLEKELKQVENNLKRLDKQKNEKISALYLELENAVRLARQPLLDLEAERDSKMLILKRETENLVKLEKPLVEGLDAAKKLAEQANDEFQMLGTKNPQLKAPAMFYIPFYVACYQTGSANRYLFFAPSMTSAVGFGVKLKGVMGISNIKEMITPRFKAITVLIEKVQLLAKQDSLLNQQITDLGERNNLLRNELTRVNIAKGLVYLKDAGWLSQREYQSLANSLAQS